MGYTHLAFIFKQSRTIKKWMWIFLRRFYKKKMHGLNHIYLVAQTIWVCEKHLGQNMDIVNERICANVFVYASSEGSGESVPSLLDGTISTVPKSQVLVQLRKATIGIVTCTVYFHCTIKHECVWTSDIFRL